MAEEISGPPPVKALGESLLFQGLDESQLTYVQPNLRFFQFGQGEAIFRKDDPAGDLYLIVNGLVTIRDPGPARRRGRDVALLRAGMFFGEVSFIDSKPRSMDAVCGTATSAAAFSQEAFYGIVAEQPLIGAAILHNLASVLCDRLRRTNSEVMELSTLPGEDAGGTAGSPATRVGLYRRLRGSGGD
jgi:CRP-like cAMP-binding protein